MRSEDIKKNHDMPSSLNSENTGYSLSEALILASFNPKYDTDCLLNYEFSTYMLCTSNCFDIQNNL